MSIRNKIDVNIKINKMRVIIEILLVRNKITIIRNGFETT